MLIYPQSLPSQTSSPPDFDGDGTISISDFLLFVDVFGASRGDGVYEERFDLDGNGAIGISDFLIFVDNFGKNVPFSNKDVGKTVSGTAGDLSFQFSISDSALTAGQSFTIETTLQNEGNNEDAVIYYHRSTDADINHQTDAYINLEFLYIKASDTGTVLLDWRAPPYAGTYYYGICVPDQDNDWKSHCTKGVRVTVEGNEEGVPDLIVQSFYSSHDRVPPGAQVTLSFDVKNQGTGPAAPTTIRWYNSTDAIIDATDTEGIIEYGQYLYPPQSTHRYTFHFPAPFDVGTYYYGRCVDPTIGEIEINNNCSTGVRLIVEKSEKGSPDLVISLPLIIDDSPATREFKIGAHTRNIGDGPPASSIQRYYHSIDATIDASDTQIVIPYHISNLVAWGHYHNLIRTSWPIITAPASPGTYYYGVCVDPAPDEIDTTNNCSEAVPINVGVPDLVVDLTWTSTSAPLVGQPFTFSTAVRNQGPRETSSTTIRYYRSDDPIIDTNDTQLGIDSVSRLTAINGVISGPFSYPDASGTTHKTIDVSASDVPGTYYYGACVDPVPSETHTNNNCSAGVKVRVTPDGEDPFNIELVFLDDFSDDNKALFQQAARRWETIITEGLPDVDFSTDPQNIGLTLVSDTVDDLRIFVLKDALNVAGLGGPYYTRPGNPVGLPAVGGIIISDTFIDRYRNHEPLYQVERILRDLMLHEITHVLGFGTLGAQTGLVRDLFGDTYFSGARAIEAFNAAGGENYRGNKVPVEFGEHSCNIGGSHWRAEVFRGLERRYDAEIMEPTIERTHVISAITIQALADLGYVVDVSQADPYRLSPRVSSVIPPQSAQSLPSAGRPLTVTDIDDVNGRITRTVISDGAQY